jgi:hypothetical protein
MTREEAIKHGKEQLEVFGGEHREFIEMAIKAIEQESVLDKIMEEIEQVKSIMNEEIINNNRKDLINFVNGLNQSLIIVERYKAESEEWEE